MCDHHHAEQTDRLGWGPFQRKYGFDGREMVERYWRAWPGRASWEKLHDHV
jgi:hypothetical protein